MLPLVSAADGRGAIHCGMCSCWGEIGQSCSRALEGSSGPRRLDQGRNHRSQPAGAVSNVRVAGPRDGFVGDGDGEWQMAVRGERGTATATGRTHNKGTRGDKNTREGEGIYTYRVQMWDGCAYSPRTTHKTAPAQYGRTILRFYGLCFILILQNPTHHPTTPKSIHHPSSSILSIILHLHPRAVGMCCKARGPCRAPCAPHTDLLLRRPPPTPAPTPAPALVPTLAEEGAPRVVLLQVEAECLLAR